jgi:uncharacterized protein YdhG (YjbR/CyaY superfamily)
MADTVDEYLATMPDQVRHVSMYPIPDVEPELAAAIEPYRASKGTLKFPLRQPIPYDLIERLATVAAAQRG